MKFSILVLGSPYSNQSVNTALRFAKAVVASEHSLYRVFFYHDAVQCGNALVTPPQDDVDIPAEWQQISETDTAELIVCIASALKRGVLDTTEAERYEKNSSNLADEFIISGLGQMVDATIHSDRGITFGP